jgi:putative OmpL-like beta-barrel porin-2
MKFNKWTVGLAAIGVVSLASAARADEQMSQVQTALTQTTLSGYVDTAMQWSPGTDSAFFDGPNIPHYSFAQNDGFSLNAIDIALDKPEDSSAWAAGYHVELMGGPDSVGVPLTDSDEDTVGDLAIRQAFIRLHTPVGGNGIDWQIGVWDNIIGYESNSDPSNPNYTRSYGYTIEPTTMTGILGTYKVNDMLSISAGIADVDGGLGSITPVSAGANGNIGSANEFESDKSYMASATFTAPDSMGFMKGATASVGWVHGQDGKADFDSGSSGSFGEERHGVQNNLYIGATIPTPMNQLKVGAAFDYLWEDNEDAPASPAGHANQDDIWVAGLYGTFQATDKLSFNGRFEYFSDDSNPDDVVTLYGHSNGDALGEGFVGSGDNGEELTFTAQYNLWANVMSRAEFRWDHVEHGDAFGASENNGTGGNYGSRDKSNDFLLALNLIYQF